MQANFGRAAFGALFLVCSASAATAQWRDAFDVYPIGAPVEGLGGWVGWNDVPQGNAFVSGIQARSGPHSLRTRSGADVVRRFDEAVGGRWTVEAWVYVPTGALGHSGFVLMSSYVLTGPKRWGAQLVFDHLAGSVACNCGAGQVVSAPFVKDQWSHIRMEVDLDFDRTEVWFEGALLGTYSWTKGIFGDYQNGRRKIDALDISFEDGVTGSKPVYWDDLRLTYRGGGRVGDAYCGPAVPNSTGAPASIAGFGSAFAGKQPLRILAQGLPKQQLGYLLAARSQDFVIGPGGSQGNLCLGAPQGTFTDQIQSSGDAGTFRVDVKTGELPLAGGVEAMIGETWRFQYWYLDLNPGPTSNFTDALELTFR